MTPLQNWVKEQNALTVLKRGALSYIMRETGLSWSTVHRVYKHGRAVLETAELIAGVCNDNKVTAISIMRPCKPVPKKSAPAKKKSRA